MHSSGRRDKQSQQCLLHECDVGDQGDQQALVQSLPRPVRVVAYRGPGVDYPAVTHKYFTIGVRRERARGSQGTRTGAWERRRQRERS